LVPAAAAALTFVWLGGQRIVYPHELEWMEGAMVDHAGRIADGAPLYCAPGPEHVPFLYAPLSFWLGGALMAAGVDGLFALRSRATPCPLGAAVLTGHGVGHAGGCVVPGLVASGLFLAGYGCLVFCYDPARKDGLFV